MAQRSASDSEATERSINNRGPLRASRGTHTLERGNDPADTVLNRPPWVTTTLGCFLIFTIVVDILGNLLVIFSVYRNKKLRNAALSSLDSPRLTQHALCRCQVSAVSTLARLKAKTSVRNVPIIQETLLRGFQ
uniref:Melatonin receptor 1a n=1 Tax=Knipowitschia caucasica TaxID=637954 RepID=A0AAV2LKR8_KNICA